MHLITKLTEMVVRNWPLANGSGRVIDRVSPWLRVPPGQQRCRTADGFEMTVIGDELIGRHLLLSGQFDRSIFQLLLDFAEPGDTLIDVGANIGYASCLFLASVPDSRVVAVEPQPEILALLRTNLGRFHPSRSTVHGVGLSDHDGEAWMEINPGNRGASRIVEDAAAAVRVPILSGESFFAGLERADLVKLDIEGLEAPVVRSAFGELARLRPKAIIFEDHALGATGDPTNSPVPRMLGEIGYSCRAIAKTATSTRLVPLDSPLRARANDFLAVWPEGDLPARAQRRLHVQ